MGKQTTKVQYLKPTPAGEGGVDCITNLRKKKLRLAISFRFIVVICAVCLSFTIEYLSTLCFRLKHTVSGRMNKLFHALVSPLASAAFLSSSLFCLKLFEVWLAETSVLKSKEHAMSKS